MGAYSHFQLPSESLLGSSAAINDEAHFQEVPFLFDKTFLEKKKSPHIHIYRNVSIVILYLIKLAQNINHHIHCTCISIHAYVSPNMHAYIYSIYK